ncbi:MAG: nucleotidyltransferase family protein, partial [Polyangiales bacterium]
MSQRRARETARRIIDVDAALAHPEPAPGVHRFYEDTLEVLTRGGVPFLIGGGYALRAITGVVRKSPDLDLFIRPGDRVQVEEVLRAGGYEFVLPFKHWLGKVRQGDRHIDVIFNSGNGVALVDDAWFDNSIPATMFARPVSLCPVEEMIWSKAFVLERERCDIADVAHLLRACGEVIDWPRLLARFDQHWRVLFSQLVLFGFVYPDEAALVPQWVTDDLVERLQGERAPAPSTTDDAGRICQGTLLSREQYLIDVERWGYRDARLAPEGTMRASEVEVWTAAI